MASERLFLKQEEMAMIDEFAGKALQGLLAGFYSNKDKSMAIGNNTHIYDEAYAMAYEMILARRRLIDFNLN